MCKQTRTRKMSYIAYPRSSLKIFWLAQDKLNVLIALVELSHGAAHGRLFPEHVARQKTGTHEVGFRPVLIFFVPFDITLPALRRCASRKIGIPTRPKMCCLAVRHGLIFFISTCRLGYDYLRYLFVGCLWRSECF